VSMPPVTFRQKGARYSLVSVHISNIFFREVELIVLKIKNTPVPSEFGDTLLTTV
jgi:hypothetical protein